MCPTGRQTTQTIVCSIDCYGPNSGCGPAYPPAGNLAKNGGYEGAFNGDTPANWTGIPPTSPGGEYTSPVWQGAKSLGQGQVDFDGNGYAGGIQQTVRGLNAGDLATVTFALWSDGGNPQDICFSGYLGTVLLVPEPCAWVDNNWNYVTVREWVNAWVMVVVPMLTCVCARV